MNPPSARLGTGGCRQARRWQLPALMALMVLLSACEQPSQLERIQKRGELIVATRNAATTYYDGAQGPDGLEYQLVSRFARELGVKPRFVLPQDIKQLLEQVRDSKVHMAAAGLSITERREQTLRFSRPYQTVTEHLVYRRGSRRPRDLSDIKPGTLEIVADSSHASTLELLTAEYPQLQWVERDGVSQATLLSELERGNIAYTVADSNDLAMAGRIYRHARAAFEVGESQQLAWAFPQSGDNSLLQAANRFLKKLEDEGTLGDLLQHYYGHTERMNFVDKRDFRRHMRERLPLLKGFFLKAAEDAGFDWRLLAAIAYQESHWRADAISPTGVRGVMMLTRSTARQVGIKNRQDPALSIAGGARYLNIVLKKIPKRIQGHDRKWLMLAAYNIGFGHLEDARILAQRDGADPDRWADVRQYLPLLTQEEYYSTVRRGYARGHEPVQYVDNIRNYFDLLVWYSKHPELLEEE